MSLCAEAFDVRQFSGKLWAMQIGIQRNGSASVR